MLFFIILLILYWEINKVLIDLILYNFTIPPVSLTYFNSVS
jgi:hypothetical protein